MLDRASVDDHRCLGQMERVDRGADLVAARGGRDRPGDACRGEAGERIAHAGQGDGLTVVNVEALPGSPIDDLGHLVTDRHAGRGGHLGGQATTVHADQRLEGRVRRRDAVLGKRLLPRGDARADRVDEGPVEVEHDRGRTRGRWHGSYDTEPMPSELAHHWMLDPSVTFLNHGSFGATPGPVLAAQDRWRARMEREPVAFLARDLEPALDAVREALGAFVGADPDDLALVPNATAAINTVARSVRLEPGDEVVVLDHAYTAARNALEAAARAAGARTAVAEIPFPGTRPDDVVRAVLDATTARTRLVLLDHVTSTTALVLPVRELVAALVDRGIDALVDGAHAPGMVDLDLDALGAAYTAANCHKWMCAPKGSAFLHVRRDRQDRVRPLSISHGATSPRTDRSRFRLEHDWTGTYDPTPWLAIPDAIAFGDGLVPGGWPALRDRGHAIALAGRDRLCEALGEPVPAPDEMIGTMAAVPLPWASPGERPPSTTYADPVHAALVSSSIQVAIGTWPIDTSVRAWRRLVRFSVAPYVDLDDLQRLAAELTAILAPA